MIIRQSLIKAYCKERGIKLSRIALIELNHIVEKKLETGIKIAKLKNRRTLLDWHLK